MDRNLMSDSDNSLTILCSPRFYKNIDERQGNIQLYTYHANQSSNENTVPDSYAAG